MVTPASAKSENLPWYALQVRTRLEKSVSASLGNQGYECFLPTYEIKRRWSDRMKKAELPLFPGYLFCRFDSNNRLPILMTPHLIQIVGIGKKPLAVNDAEIDSVRAVVRSGLQCQPWPFLHIGQRVHVQHGPLCGLEGILLVFKGSQRIVVSVSLLQRSVALEVDSSWVTPVRPQPEIHSAALAQWSSLGRATA